MAALSTVGYAEVTLEQKVEENRVIVTQAQNKAAISATTINFLFIIYSPYFSIFLTFLVKVRFNIKKRTLFFFGN